jgi:hypothetical protein
LLIKQGTSLGGSRIDGYAKYKKSGARDDGALRFAAAGLDDRAAGNDALVLFPEL